MNKKGIILLIQEYRNIAI